MLASVVSDFWHFFYVPAGHHFWEGAVWGNVVAVSILAPAAYLWSRTRFWPLRLIHGKLDAIRHHGEQAHTLAHQTHEMMEEVHYLAHHGEPHPRVVARQARQ